MPRLKPKTPLREAARGESCVACGAPGAVLAHLADPGQSGVGQKCDDEMGAHLCGRCHYEADHGRYRRDYKWRHRMIGRTAGRLVISGKWRLVPRETVLPKRVPRPAGGFC